MPYALIDLQFDQRLVSTLSEVLFPEEVRLPGFTLVVVVH